MLFAGSLLLGACLATPVRAAEDEQACCRIIRVDLEKSTAWLRNPRSALVVQFRIRADERDLFKVGDLFNPRTTASMAPAPAPLCYVALGTRPAQRSHPARAWP
jgi:hypothetical protein